ncbi:MAG: stage III sporulation protein AF [Eubacteriales bacterium]|nr:stage III sporulation protein AF [Eubacteriales bacterium]MDD4583711.1 stage III sporulation protein AF [Eubacteriales bacterium]
MREWVWNIFLMIAALSFVEIVLPDGSMQKYLKFIFSLMILSVIVYPLGDEKSYEISVFSPAATQQAQVPVKMDQGILNQIMGIQTKQIQEIYNQKQKSLNQDVKPDKIQGISIPWADIYSNDKEEPN